MIDSVDIMALPSIFFYEKIPDQDNFEHWEALNESFLIWEYELENCIRKCMQNDNQFLAFEGEGMKQDNYKPNSTVP